MDTAVSQGSTRHDNSPNAQRKGEVQPQAFSKQCFNLLCNFRGCMCGCVSQLLERNWEASTPLPSWRCGASWQGGVHVQGLVRNEKATRLHIQLFPCPLRPAPALTRSDPNLAGPPAEVLVAAVGGRASQLGGRASLNCCPPRRHCAPAVKRERASRHRCPPPPHTPPRCRRPPPRPPQQRRQQPPQVVPRRSR